MFSDQLLLQLATVTFGPDLSSIRRESEITKIRRQTLRSKIAENDRIGMYVVQSAIQTNRRKEKDTAFACVDSLRDKRTIPMV